MEKVRGFDCLQWCYKCSKKMKGINRINCFLCNFQAHIECGKNKSKTIIETNRMMKECYGWIYLCINCQFKNNTKDFENIDNFEIQSLNSELSNYKKCAIAEIDELQSNLEANRNQMNQLHKRSGIIKKEYGKIDENFKENIKESENPFNIIDCSKKNQGHITQEHYIFQGYYIYDLVSIFSSINQFYKSINYMFTSITITDLRNNKNVIKINDIDFNKKCSIMNDITSKYQNQQLQRNKTKPKVKIKQIFECNVKYNMLKFRRFCGSKPKFKMKHFICEFQYKQYNFREPESKPKVKMKKL